MFQVEWADDFGTRQEWRRLGLKTMGVAIVVPVLTLFDASASPLYSFLRAWALALVAVVLTYSFATDYKLRLVDRRLLNFAIVATLPLEFVALFYTHDWVTLTVFLALIIFSAFIYLFVFSIGASDARALMLVASALVPVLGWNGFIWGTFATGIFFMVVGFTVAIVTRNLKNHFPAVPMLLAPYWLTLLATVFIALPLWYNVFNRR